MRKYLGSLFFLTLLWPLGAGADFIAVEWKGRVLAVNEQNGESRLIGRAGFRNLNSLAMNRAGQLFSVSDNWLITIDPSTGWGSRVVRLDFGEIAVDVRGLACAPDGTVFAINHRFTAADLFTVDPDTGIGNRVDRWVNGRAQSLEISSEGVFYPYSFYQSLAFAPDGRLFGVAQRDDGFQNNLFLVDPDPDARAHTFITELFPLSRVRNQDIRGIAFLFDTIAIDIKPDSDNNRINPASRGVVSVAILGSEDFQVADIDVGTLAFGPANATPVNDVVGKHKDLNGDGFPDLLARFGTDEVGIEFGDTESCLNGETLDDRAFKGCDAIQTVPR